MKKTVFSALVALTIILLPGVALATEQQNMAIVGPVWDMPIGVTPTVGVNNVLDLPFVIDKSAKLLESGANVIVTGGSNNIDETVTTEMYSDIFKAALRISPKQTALLVRVGGANHTETQYLLSSYLASAHFFDGPVTRIYPTLNLHRFGQSVVGASWDMPIYSGSVIKPEVDMDDPTKLQENIESAASILSNGGDLLVAGGTAGPVSESTYQKIIDRAAQINPEHIGSIVRIGGEDQEQTVRFMGSYVDSELWLLN